MDVSVMADISTLDVPQKVLPLSGHHVMTNVHVVYYYIHTVRPIDVIQT